MNAKDNSLLGITTLIIALLALLLAIGAFVRISKLSAAVETQAESATAAGEETEPVKKVVYHADFRDPARFSSMLLSINNMVNEYEATLEEYDIRIVFVAQGIRFLTQDKLTGTPFEEDEELRERRQELLNRVQSAHEVQNIRLELCDITRNAAGLERSGLIPGVELVPSGVVRIAELQEQGFAYIKVK